MQIIDLEKIRNLKKNREMIRNVSSTVNKITGQMRASFFNAGRRLSALMDEINQRPPLRLIESDVKVDSTYYANKNKLSKQEMDKLIRDCNNNVSMLKNMIETASKK